MRCKGKLYASITGIPVLTVVEEDKIKMAEINFLCVHKTIRDKRLAPVLIREVTRRINLKDKWQAVWSWLKEDLYGGKGVAYGVYQGEVLA